PTNTTFPLRVNTNRDPMYPTFWPFINRPIAPGASDQYHLSLRFGTPGSTLQALGGDLYQSFGAVFPSQLNWADRRPIGMLILGTSNAGYPTNPRGWLLDPTIDVTTAAGLAAFKTRVLQWADNSIQILQSANAQGMITWDIEGEQFPQPTSYVCDPTVLATTAPEMANVADAYFQKFRDAGLKVGVCVRPQQFVLGPGGSSASQQDVADPTQLLINKINYARSRWGATIFYIDSDGGPGSPMDPGVLQRVSAAEPGVLIMPEHSNLQYYAYSAPYRQVNQGYMSAEADARLVYPQGFAILNLADAPIQQDYAQLLNAVSQGDVLMFRGWFDDGSLASVKSIYQAAGHPATDTTPPSISISSPLPNSTISTTVTVSASASDNVGVARVQFLVDSTPIGAAILTPPYSTTLNPALFANGPHTLVAVATDHAGNSGSASIAITIANATADTLPPTVSITAPASASSVSGTITLTASASDNVGVASVQFKLDGVNYGVKLTSAPYSATLDTTTLSNAQHSVSAVAMDAAGNAGNSSTVSFTVNNVASGAPSSGCSPGANTFIGCYYNGQNFNTLVFTRTDPVIHFDWSGTGPQGPIALGPDNYSVRWLGNFQFQAGTYQFTLNTDDGGKLLIDGQQVYSNWVPHGALPVSVNATLTAGTHLIEFDYFQAQGGAVAQLSWSGPSGGAPAPVGPAPAQPTISITSPANGATLSGTVNIAATVSAPAGVTGVQFQIDGANVGAQLTAAPYSITVNTSSVANGSHSLTATVRDQAGNNATSPAVTVTISNAAAPAPTAPQSCGPAATNAFMGCYYSGQNFDVFVFNRTDPVIHFDWSGTGPQGPAALGPDNYSVRWQGNFSFQGGSYQFTVSSDDGSRLYIDGQLIYSNWSQHGALPVPVGATLTAGTHLIEMDYFQSQGSAVAQLSWSPAQ
ncbi:MAG TPA: Ig-like domain-containing protein, partial [Bryobacteraceae bacterium]|nr:Ig-like domain-containing protein [Bryobacteraceae bacterium]